jgi:hypothetical protein
LRAVPAYKIRAIGAAPKRVIPARGDAEREAALPDDNRVELPPVQDLVGCAGQRGSRYFPDVGELEIVRNIIGADVRFTSDEVERILAPVGFEQLGPDVVGQDRKSMTEALLEIPLQ